MTNAECKKPNEESRAAAVGVVDYRLGGTTVRLM